jgi:hypothetical protein
VVPDVPIDRVMKCRIFLDRRDENTFDLSILPVSEPRLVKVEHELGQDNLGDFLEQRDVLIQITAGNFKA